MGREIRRVPPNWQHPQRKPEAPYYREGLQPMRDQAFADAAAEWKDAFAAWEQRERPSYCCDDSRNLEYWEWNGEPPQREYYRPWADEEATWYQLWENVSEGTPVSPPFATKEELADYLAAHGDGGWGASKPGGWGKKQAYAFVMGDGYAPSMAVVDGRVMSGVEFVTTHPKPTS